MTTIIYHEVRKGIPCADGFAASWVANKARSGSTIIGCVYGDPVPEIPEGEEVIIVDFSFPKADLEALADRGCSVLVLDHHQTAWKNLQDLSARINATFDMAECGATLTWKHFFPTYPMPAFLEYVRDRDLWQKKLPLTEELNAAFGRIGRTFKLYDILEPMQADVLQTVYGGLGKQLLQEKAEKIKAIATRAEMIQIDEYLISGVRLTQEEGYLTSDICEYLYTTTHPDAPFVCCITFEGTYSLRSSKVSNFDVSLVAERHGGGGHKNSAGFFPVLV